MMLEPERLMIPSSDSNTTLRPPETRREPRQRWVAWPNIGWKGYLALDRLRGGEATPRLIYLDGTVYLGSPSYSHERTAELLGLFIRIVTEELDLPCTGAGRTTLRCKPKSAGIGGDNEFYLAGASRIANNTDLDMNVDPPPDLIIESVYSNPLSKALVAYRRLGVPEIWVGKPEGLRILLLQENGRYASSKTSRSFPFLEAQEIFSVVTTRHGDSETAWMKGVRRWVREILVARVTPGEV